MRSSAYIMDMNAKKYCERIGKIETLISHKIEEIEFFKERALNPFSPCLENDKVRASMNKDRLAESVVDYVELERECEKEYEKYLIKRREFIKTIEQLSVRAYDLLYKIYIGKFSYYEVAELYDRSYSWVTTNHSRAIKELQALLNKREEDEIKRQNQSQKKD